MLTINDFAEMDEYWKSTKYCGSVGAKILNILNSRKTIFRGKYNFDIEFEYFNGKTIYPGKYIIEGFPHNSEEEALLVREIVKYFPIRVLPKLWECTDFIDIDREIAYREIDELFSKRIGNGVIRGFEITLWAKRFIDKIEVKVPNGSKHVPIDPGIYALWSHDDVHYHTRINDNFNESFMAKIDELRGKRIEIQPQNNL
ncbi:hypothetical protein V8N79_004358 [Salmonella enterica]